MLRKLRILFSRKEKQFFLILLFFSVLVSFVETVAISSLMPFISIATDFTVIHSNKYYDYFYKYFNFDSELGFAITFGIVLIAFYFFRTLLNLIYMYGVNKFTIGKYHVLSYRLFKNYMRMPYKDFTTKNSSVLTKSIINEALNLVILLWSILLFMTESFVVVFIYIAMLYVNYKITLVLSLVLALNALLMLKVISKRIKRMGVLREDIQKKFYEIINKNFKNFKLIKLQKSDEQTLKSFSDISDEFAQINLKNNILNEIPKYFLELLGFSIIVLIMVYMLSLENGDISKSMAILSMFILALYRLLPSVNRLMLYYNKIIYYYRSLDVVYEDLMCETENLLENSIQFNDKLDLKNIIFEYEEGKQVLNSINLSIKKGSKIAFTGESGSGKSTLVDIIIGLHKPTQGSMSLDGIAIDSSNVQNWRSKIGYIPQDIYLFDGTVGENVAFGLSFNQEKIDKALKKAKIFDYLEQKEGSDTLVGEGGIMLSGGQKQRIAIARALYGEPEVLVLDEATSALDTNVEAEIMKEIYEISEGRTLIIIAHRLSTIEHCDIIYNLDNGKIL